MSMQELNQFNRN